jgi:flagellar protein FliS
MGDKMELVENSLGGVINKYRKVEVETADQLSLVNLLYDGLVRFLKGAVDDLENNRPHHKNCARARDIAFHLFNTTRDDGSDMSKNLRSLLFFIYKNVIIAHMEKSSTKIEEILPVAEKLRSAWFELKSKDDVKNNEE